MSTTAIVLAVLLVAAIVIDVVIGTLLRKRVELLEARIAHARKEIAILKGFTSCTDLQLTNLLQTAGSLVDCLQTVGGLATTTAREQAILTLTIGNILASIGKIVPMLKTLEGKVGPEKRGDRWN